MGYFLGGNPYVFRMNPAFQSERGIFSLALGQTGVGISSNLGVNTLLYPGENSVYTFMNDAVPAEEFLRKIGKKNSLGADARVNLLTVGGWKGNSFITVDFNLRSLNGLSAPYDVFRFLKEGTGQVSTFDFSGMGVRSQSFLEAAFGWSHNFGDKFNIGFRLKALVGVEQIDLRLNRFDLTMDQDRWLASSAGSFTASSPSLSIDTDADGNLVFDSLRTVEEYGPAGFGGAVDLGFSWNILPQLTLSGAVLDLGAISWNHEIAGTAPESTYTWYPSEHEAVDAQGGQDAFERELDEIVDAFSGMFSFRAIDGKPSFERLPLRFLVGAEFRMPFYDRLSLGALYLGRNGDCFVRHNGRVSVNWNPLNFISMSVGSTVNKVGESIGFAFNFHPAGINLLVGCDYIPFSVVSIAPLLDDLPAQYERFAVIPAGRMNMNVYVGLNLALGSRRLDHKKYTAW